MENLNKLESGFQIKNLILLESSFFRINNVAFGEGVNNNLDINTDVAVNDKVITVAEEATLVQKFQDVEQVKIKVKMIGIFECIGESALKDFDEFGKINGAAIIFPYIREHITNISLKAGIGAIILPPVNFTKNK
ncbi:MAG: protein-export chaperone SecB [Candidatus Symbiothrix sp.]|jgi:preprotein translocase subunit SecB|nr:protein-export chaperone SecB [Candidatus Symbiothrix sp.]